MFNVKTKHLNNKWEKNQIIKSGEIKKKENNPIT